METRIRPPDAAGDTALVVVAPHVDRGELEAAVRALNFRGVVVVVASTIKGDVAATRGELFHVDKSLAECSAKEFDRLAVIGGSEIMDIVNDDDLLRLVREFIGASKPVAGALVDDALCACMSTNASRSDRPGPRPAGAGQRGRAQGSRGHRVRRGQPRRAHDARARRAPLPPGPRRVRQPAHRQGLRTARLVRVRQDVCRHVLITDRWSGGVSASLLSLLLESFLCLFPAIRVFFASRGVNPQCR